MKYTHVVCMYIYIPCMNNREKECKTGAADGNEQSTMEILTFI